MSELDESVSERSSVQEDRCDITVFEDGSGTTINELGTITYVSRDCIHWYPVEQTSCDLEIDDTDYKVLSDGMKPL